MVLSVADVIDDTPDSERSFMRKIRSSEKLLAQGFPPADVMSFMSSRLAQKAAGNAYPVPLLLAVLQPLVKLLERDDFDFANWPPENMCCTDERAQELVRRARKMFLASSRRTAEVTRKRRRQASPEDDL